MVRGEDKGFLLAETVITIALIVFIATLTAPFAMKFTILRAFEEQSDTVIAMLLTARDQSLSGKNGTGFGVKFFPNKYVLFEGASYAARVPAKDETLALPGGMTVNQGIYSDEIVFTAAGGTAAGGTATGASATVEMKRGAFVRTIIFNAYGAMSASPITNLSVPPAATQGTYGTTPPTSPP